MSTMLTFRTHGPFEIPLTGAPNGKYIEDFCPEFWKRHPDHKDDICLYIFAKRAAKGFQPIYVGMTIKSFGKEAFHSHKIASHYTPALMKKGKGTLVMFFVVPDPRPGPTPKKLIGEIETFMIQAAYAKNPDLSNKKDASGPEWCVEGILRGTRRRPNFTEAKFKKMMGLLRTVPQVTKRKKK